MQLFMFFSMFSSNYAYISDQFIVVITGVCAAKAEDFVHPTKAVTGFLNEETTLSDKKSPLTGFAPAVSIRGQGFSSKAEQDNGEINPKLAPP